MGKGGIPDRWIPYSPMGSIIPGTRFIACKVPLKDGLLRSLPEKQRFGPKHLLEAYPKIGLLVDLTNTTRYYFKQEFTDNNIRYEKIFCPGKVVPPNSIVNQFFNVVDDYLASELDPDAVIVVHCTHGVNRTGYFICRYMINKMNIPPEEALKNFRAARGHDIERENYVSDLKNGCKGGSESDLSFQQDFRQDRKRDFGGNITSRRGSHRSSGPRQNNQDRIPGNYNKYRSNDYQSNDKARHMPHQRNKYFDNIDRQQNLKEDSIYSNNWRVQRTNTNNCPFPSTTPLPQFTPGPHSRVPGQPLEVPRRGHHSTVLHNDTRSTKRGNFTRTPPTDFRKKDYSNNYNPLPQFCRTETSLETATSSLRHVEESVRDPDNSYHHPAKRALPPSRDRGPYHGRDSRGRGKASKRGYGNRGRSHGRAKEGSNHTLS